MPPTGTTRGTGALAAQLLLGLLCEVALAGVAAIAFIADQRGQVDSTEVATIELMGASAAVGVLIMLLLLVATIAGRRGPLTVAWWLAALRLLGVIAGVLIIAVGMGTPAVVGLVETFAVALALLDATIGLFVARATARRLSR